MSQRALIVLLFVVGVPVLAYFLVKNASEDAVDMPKRWFYDSVVTKTENGKLVHDTLWHRVSNFCLTNQLGNQVCADDLKNKILIVDFFFTRCPNPCPTLTRNMKKLQDSYLKNDTLVHFLSFSVDPARDSVVALKNYADRFGVRHHNWWMLTGDKKVIYDLALNELKASVVDAGGNVDSSFIHTSYFYLLDKNRVVRGWYNGTDSASLTKLARDVSLLILEKDKTKKRNLFRK
jgi:protein SCO1/2